MAFPHFQLLAPEVQAEVSSFLPTHDLLNLIRVSKRVQRLITPKLLTRVNLDLVVYEPVSIHNPVECSNRQQVTRAQRRIVRTVATHPEQADYIRDLTWHVFLDEDTPCSTVAVDWRDLPNPMLLGFDKAFPVAPVTIQPSRPTSVNPFDFFRCLVMVQRVRLHLSQGNTVAPVPEMLFPRAHTVSLSGFMSVDVVRSVLHSPMRLRELCLDHIHGLAASFTAQLLDHLTGRCDSLQRLTLCKGGNSRADEPFDVSAEALTLTQFARLANSCRSTLQYIKLALTPILHGIVLFGPDMRSAHFREFVMPGLLDPSLGAWSRLQTLEFEGITVDAEVETIFAAAIPRAQVVEAVSAPLAAEWKLVAQDLRR